LQKKNSLKECVFVNSTDFLQTAFSAICPLGYTLLAVFTPTVHRPLLSLVQKILPTNCHRNINDDRLFWPLIALNQHHTTSYTNFL